VAVESVQFHLFLWTQGDATPAPYTVPGGFLAVVTDAQIIQAGSGRVLSTLDLEADGVPIVRLDIDQLGGGATSWRGRVALAAGAVMQPYLSAYAASVAVSISGYLYS